MDRELELKFRVHDKTSYKKILQELGIDLIDVVYQKDMIFLRKGKKFSDLEKGEVVIRIRVENDGKSEKMIVCLKKYVTGIRDREEVEFKIWDIETFKNFLALLDFVLIVEVKKSREIGFYQNATITLDSVEGLGSFTEIEIMSEKKEAEHNFNRLKTIINKLGLEITDAVSVPYDEMLFEANKYSI